MLETAAWVERNRWAEPELLKPCVCAPFVGSTDASSRCAIDRAHAGSGSRDGGASVGHRWLVMALLGSETMFLQKVLSSSAEPAGARHLGAQKLGRTLN